MNFPFPTLLATAIEQDIDTGCKLNCIHNRVFNDSCLIRRIQQDKIYKK